MPSCIYRHLCARKDTRSTIGNQSSRSTAAGGNMLTIAVALLSLMVVICVIGLGLYAHELSRQARVRQEADNKARDEARQARLHDLYDSLDTNERFLHTFCHPG